MNSRIIYTCGVTAVLVLTLLTGSIPVGMNKRVWQHRDDSMVRADINVNIEPEHFSSHLPVISIDTGGKEIPGKPGPNERISSIPDSSIPAKAEIFDEKNVLNSLNSEASFESDASIRIRGNS